MEFDSHAFRTLFNEEYNIRDEDNLTALMALCSRNANLLERDLWFIPKLL